MVCSYRAGRAGDSDAVSVGSLEWVMATGQLLFTDRLPVLPDNLPLRPSVRRIFRRFAVSFARPPVRPPYHLFVLPYHLPVRPSVRRIIRRFGVSFARPTVRPPYQLFVLPYHLPVRASVRRIICVSSTNLPSH